MRVDLNGIWLMNSPHYHDLEAQVPGSVLSTLLAHNLIPDPFWGTCEAEARACLYEDYTFTRTFSMTDEQRKNVNYLFLNGIDTVAEIAINGVFVTTCRDMHLRQRVLLDNHILSEQNVISISFTSPYRYIQEYNDGGLFASYGLTEPKGPCIRKAHYMFGWDWGPNLGDMGIFRDIYILSTAIGYLDSFRHEVTFLPDGSAQVNVDTSMVLHTNGRMTVELSLPEDHFRVAQTCPLETHGSFSFRVPSPKRWYPAGFGDPVLYRLDIIVEADNMERLCESFRIGLREVVIDNDADAYGTNFCVSINGCRVFLKGSCYIPEDNILSRVTPGRTAKLLELAKNFNHNCIRIWGGGYYPDDSFYDWCDENGLLVWQDLMFACSVYNIYDTDFRNLIIAETIDVVKRFRHHASVFLIAGDNECEDGVNGHEPERMESYRVMSLEVLTPLMKTLTSTHFQRTSPRSVEIFQHQNDCENYDTHYWGIWCFERPIEEYKLIYPRMLSEVGHQAFPMLSELRSFAKDEELTSQSAVMCHHQKQPGSNARIERYVSQCYGIPEKFEDMVQLSQLVQADAIKTCTEHLRRNKARCNGILYWQLNDCWPAISWSSVDYDHGLKALHYASKRFFAPCLVSLSGDVENLTVSVSNDSLENVEYRLIYQLQNLDGRILYEQALNGTIPGASCRDVLEICKPFGDDTEKDRQERLVYVALLDMQGNLLSENYQQPCRDDMVPYREPHYHICALDAEQFTIESDTFTKSVCLQPLKPDVVFSDNFFSLQKGKPKVITSNFPLDVEELRVWSVNQVVFQKENG